MDDLNAGFRQSRVNPKRCHYFRTAEAVQVIDNNGFDIAKLLSLVNQLLKSGTLSTELPTALTLIGVPADYAIAYSVGQLLDFKALIANRVFLSLSSVCSLSLRAFAK